MTANVYVPDAAKKKKAPAILMVLLSGLAVGLANDGISGIPGVVRLSTGAWYDPAPDGLERHGNPNALTLDLPASELSQGCAAQTCLVEIEPWRGEVPPVRAHELPALE